MAGSRTLKLSILADVDNLKGGLDKGKQELGGFEGALADFGKKVAAAFAVGEIINFGKALATAAMEEEAAQTRLAETLKAFTGATQEQTKANEKFIDQLSVTTAIADDNLRPAMERLARSLGNVESAQKATELAARISVNTGKDLALVAEAMGKAADGQTGALAKLGLGFSAAELKGKDFGTIVGMLNEKFPDLGANADTASFKFKQFQNLIENTKESLGAALLPIIEKFFTFVIENLNPALERVARLFSPIVNAIKENKQAFEDLGKVLEVVVGVVLFLMEKMVGKIADSVAGIINLFGKIEGAIRPALQAIANAINWVIEQYNRIPFLGDIGKISLPSFGGGGSSSSASGAGLLNTLGSLSSSVSSLSDIASAVGGGGSSKGGGGSSDAAILAQIKSLTAIKDSLETMAADIEASQAVLPVGYQGQFGMGLSGGLYGSTPVVNNITVNGALDAEGTAQTIVNVLNDSAARGGAGIALSSNFAVGTGGL